MQTKHYLIEYALICIHFQSTLYILVFILDIFFLFFQKIVNSQKKIHQDF